MLDIVENPTLVCWQMSTSEMPSGHLAVTGNHSSLLEVPFLFLEVPFLFLEVPFFFLEVPFLLKVLFLFLEVPFLSNKFEKEAAVSCNFQWRL